MEDIVDAVPKRHRHGDDAPQVLLVDDEPAVLSALSRQLRGYFQVSTAVGGKAALEMSMQREHRFAAVMTDMRMPVCDGLEVLKGFRKNQPDAIRLLLTG